MGMDHKDIMYYKFNDGVALQNLGKTWGFTLYCKRKTPQKAVHYTIPCTYNW